MAHSLLLMNHK